MSDPRRPDAYDPNRPQWSQPTEQLGSQYPPVDPAYGSYYSYPGYPPATAANPTQPLPPYWTQTQYQPPPPPPEEPPPGPPKSPRWLWVLAGGAVTLVVGLVIALVIANGSTRDDTAVAPLPPMPETTTSVPLPTTTRTTAPTPTTTSPRTSAPTATAPPGSPTTTTDAAATETVVYNVTGEGRAISITYVDTGGMLQMEFNVVLPWTREVALSPSTAKAASVTVINVGREVSCSITLNGAQMQQRSGTGLTICSSVGN